MNAKLGAVIIILSSLFFKTEAQNIYPKEIIASHFEQLYDEAKWRLYCINSDKPINFNKNAFPEAELNATYGLASLRFYELEISGDTAEVSFGYYYRDTILNINTVSNFPPLTTVVFDIISSKVLMYGNFTGYTMESGLTPDSLSAGSRFLYPLQPEIIKFIKENKDKLDPWFRAEAIKRGVIVK